MAINVVTAFGADIASRESACCRREFIRFRILHGNSLVSVVWRFFLFPILLFRGDPPPPSCMSFEHMCHQIGCQINFPFSKFPLQFLVFAREHRRGICREFGIVSKCRGSAAHPSHTIGCIARQGIYQQNHLVHNTRRRSAGNVTQGCRQLVP